MTTIKDVYGNTYEIKLIDSTHVSLRDVSMVMPAVYHIGQLTNQSFDEENLFKIKSVSDGWREINLSELPDEFLVLDCDGNEFEAFKAFGLNQTELVFKLENGVEILEPIFWKEM